MIKRTSDNFVGRYKLTDSYDQEKIAGIRAAVKAINNTRKNPWSKQPQLRVEVKGRKPMVKENGRSYYWGGNIVGGIKNALEADVYIYNR